MKKYDVRTILQYCLIEQLRSAFKVNFFVTVDLMVSYESEIKLYCSNAEIRVETNEPVSIKSEYADQNGNDTLNGLGKDLALAKFIRASFAQICNAYSVEAVDPFQMNFASVYIEVQYA